MTYRIEHTTSWAMSSPAGRIHPHVPYAITQMVTRDTTTAKTLQSAQATVTRRARVALDGTRVCAVYVPAPGSVVIFSRTKDGVHYADIFRVTDVPTGEIVPVFPNVPNMPAPVWAVPTSANRPTA